jgi:hypothetical protein
MRLKIDVMERECKNLEFRSEVNKGIVENGGSTDRLDYSHSRNSIFVLYTS